MFPIPAENAKFRYLTINYPLFITVAVVTTLSAGILSHCWIPLLYYGRG